VAASLAGGDPDARLLVLGGDCTSNAGAMAGLRRARPGLRLGLAWFDAHGDFNTPDTTPSGNVWGMPFAMACGRGDADLVGAVDGPSVAEADAALLGGQVLDEVESRMLAASSVAHFGAGMLATDAGQAALSAWASIVSARIDAWYIAFDLDALDASGGYSLAMPEPDGLALATATAAVRAIAASGEVLGFGATAAMARPDVDLGPTVDAIAALTEAAFA
jgi:arginase